MATVVADPFAIGGVVTFDLAGVILDLANHGCHAGLKLGVGIIQEVVDSDVGDLKQETADL